MPTINFQMRLKPDVKQRVVRRGMSVPGIMEDVMHKEMSDFVSYLKIQHLSRKGSDSVAYKSGKLYKGTTYTVQRTSAGTVIGALVVGEGTRYASLHVGTGSSGVFTTSGKKFTVPMPWVRKKDGGWISPFVPGQLMNLYPRLFRPRRGSESKLKENTLYWKVGKEIRPAFILKKTIRIPQRVKLDEIAAYRKRQMAEAMRDAFSGYDFGFLSLRITGGTVVGGFGE